MDLFDLSGRVAVVTGGNTGIGLGIARGLAKAGAKVVIAGRDAAKSADAASAIEAEGGSAVAIEVEVQEEASCRNLIDRTVEQCGRLDILVNNAGIALRKQPEDYSAEEWHRVVETNLSGAFFCAHAAYPRMLEAGGGKIINIGSMMSIYGASFAVAYSASKGGLVQMTKALTCAWAKDNIQVNAILPGWIDTEFTKSARQQVPGLNDKVLGGTPAGRWGTPADFETVSIFLASPASQFINGAVITCDGGYSSQI